MCRDRAEITREITEQIGVLRYKAFRMTVAAPEHRREHRIGVEAAEGRIWELIGELEQLAAGAGDRRDSLTT